MDGVTDIQLRYFISRIEQGNRCSRSYLSGDSVEESFFNHCFLQKAEGIKILQIPFLRRHANGGVNSVIIFRVEKLMIAVIYIFQTMKGIPVRAIHPPILFGSVAPLNFCFSTRMIRAGVNFHNSKLCADPVQLVILITAAVIDKDSFGNPELQDCFLKCLLHVDGIIFKKELPLYQQT